MGFILYKFTKVFLEKYYRVQKKNIRGVGKSDTRRYLHGYPTAAHVGPEGCQWRQYCHIMSAPRLFDALTRRQTLHGSPRLPSVGPLDATGYLLHMPRSDPIVPGTHGSPQRPQVAANVGTYATMDNTHSTRIHIAYSMAPHGTPRGRECRQKVKTCRP